MLACRPWRELSNALKNVPWSQREPKSLKGGPRMATLLAQSLGVQTYRAGPIYETRAYDHQPKSSWYISEMATLRSNKIFPRATQMGVNDAPRDWLQYVLKIESRTNLLTEL